MQREAPRADSTSRAIDCDRNRDGRHREARSGGSACATNACAPARCPPRSKGSPQVAVDPNIAAQKAKLIGQTTKHPPNISAIGTVTGQLREPASCRCVKKSWLVAGDVHVAKL